MNMDVTECDIEKKIHTQHERNIGNQHNGTNQPTSPTNTPQPTNATRPTDEMNTTQPSNKQNKHDK